jgi:hypothetical protein
LGIMSADRCHLYRTDNPSWTTSFPVTPTSPRAGIVGCLPGKPETPFCLLFFPGQAQFLVDDEIVLTIPVEHFPANPARSTLHQVPLRARLEDPNTLAVYWTTIDARLFFARLTLHPQVEELSAPVEIQTRCAVLGIQGCIDFRLVGPDPISMWDSLEEAWLAQNQLTNPVAAFPLGTSEILIVEANGALLRVQAENPHNAGKTI